MSGVWLALVALLQIIGLALVQAIMQQRAARLAAQLKSAEKQEDWRRQDAVAEKAAMAAQLLLQAQRDTITRTDEVARIAAEADARVRAQLTAIMVQGKEIHILVNSDMTAARTAERDSLRLLVLSLKNGYDLSVKLGLTLSGSEQDTIVAFEKRITELDQILADRHAAQLSVEAEAATTKAAAMKAASVVS
jgi:hypothetical protein